MTTTTTTRPTITRLADGGVILTDLPFMIDGSSTVTSGAPGRSNLIMGSRGLGWTHKVMGDIRGWVNTQPGAATEAVDRLAEFGVAVVDLSHKGAAATTRKATRKVTPAQAAPAQASDLAAKITAALVVDGVDAEIIAAAVAAATSKASEIAKGATVGVSAPEVKTIPTRKQQGKGVTTRKAAPKAAPKAALTGMSGAELAALGTAEADAEVARRAANRAAKRAARA